MICTKLSKRICLFLQMPSVRGRELKHTVQEAYSILDLMPSVRGRELKLFIVAGTTNKIFDALRAGARIETVNTYHVDILKNGCPPCGGEN